MEILEKFKKELLNNKIVSFQTETVYGLFSIINIKNKERINELKKRNSNQELQVSFSSFEQIYDWANVSAFQREIIESTLPGKISYVLPLRKEKISLIGSETILVRFPELDKKNYLLQLIKDVGPLFSTSANFHNEKEMTSCEEINNKLKIICYEENKLLENRKPSKIISLLNDKIEILRE